MGSVVSRDDFNWTYTEEPHATRRKEILRRYPEIKKLFGIDPSFKYVVSSMVLTQTILCFLLKDQDYVLLFLEAYFAGGVINHALTLAIHEISHNVVYGNQYPLRNRLFGIWANLPIGVPMSVSFKKYHVEHHRSLGENGLDTDLPTELEGKLFNNTFLKCIWLLLQPLFYAFRPIIVYRKKPTDLEILNAVLQFSYDFLIYYFCGFKGLLYLIVCTLCSMGFHPTAGHFISEHYIFKEGQETYSYYGPLNMVTFDVGLHVEHHDFPFIPGRNLKHVRCIAPEYYCHFYSHNSWLWVLYQFLTNPGLGPYARIKRKPRTDQIVNGNNMLKLYIDGFVYYCGLYQLVSALSHLSNSNFGAILSRQKFGSKRT